MTNPYASTEPDMAWHSESNRILRLPKLGMFLGSVLLLILVCSGSFILYLYIRYPGLDDPDTRPERYWPGYAVLAHSIISLIAGSVGLPIFIYASRMFRHRQTLLLATHRPL